MRTSARRVLAVGEHQHDASAVDALQRVEAEGDRIVQPRGVAVLQILDVADQVVAVVRERALTSILSLNAPTCALSTGSSRRRTVRPPGEQADIRGHARARVEHHHRGKRLGLVGKERDLHWLAVFEDDEIVSLEIGDEPPVGIHDRRVDRDGADAGAENRLIRGGLRLWLLRRTRRSPSAQPRPQHRLEQLGTACERFLWKGRISKLALR